MIDNMKLPSQVAECQEKLEGAVQEHGSRRLPARLRLISQRRIYMYSLLAAFAHSQNPCDCPEIERDRSDTVYEGSELVDRRILALLARWRELMQAWRAARLFRPLGKLLEVFYQK